MSDWLDYCGADDDSCSEDDMRSLQHAQRQRHVPNQAAEPDAEDLQEMNAGLTEEDKRKQEELANGPMQAEVKYLEKRWTKKGRCYTTEPKEDEEIPPQTNWYDQFALCITRLYDNSNRYVTRTSLDVNSSALKQILKDVIGDFPGQSFHTSNISIIFPPRCLYHFYEELQDALKDQESDSDGAKHLPILLNFIAEEFADAIKEGTNLREQGLINYEHLWTIFKPGMLLFTRSQGQPRAFKLSSYNYNCGQDPGLMLNATYVDFDGDNFGTRATSLFIPAFGGATAIADLPVLPLDFHRSLKDIDRTLTDRGRRWEALAGQNFREYKGTAFERVGCAIVRYNISGRIMIDTRTFHRIEANSAFTVNLLPGQKKRKQQNNGWDSDPDEWNLVPDDDTSENGEPGTPKQVLTDEQCLLATPIVRGFSFTEKKFLDFFVDSTREIRWNDSCFEQLVLPEQQKELVQALVAEHTKRAVSTSSRHGFDDIIKGKGRGLILVLHGPPGVGKTLTAECVAEFSHRPLYTVSSGDLGTSCETLDQRLTRTLDLAATWKAVLLIDEADVFLERRSLHDMERNGLVSIFLRTLEYYSGILFMTTNRVRTFDDAFKSRIHVPLKYDELPPESRLKVWKNFVGQLATDGGNGVEIEEKQYLDLASGQLNGRQIKNVVRTAKSLAEHKRRKLDHAQLRQVMEIQMAFEEELDGDNTGDIHIVEH
jgi:hypothetical protein